MFGCLSFKICSEHKKEFFNLQVIPLKNVESVTKLPKEIKESAISINFTDGTSRMFACDSGENIFLKFYVTYLLINQKLAKKRLCIFPLNYTTSSCFSDFDASQWKMLLEEECTRDGSGRVHEEVKGTSVCSNFLSPG